MFHLCHGTYFAEGNSVSLSRTPLNHIERKNALTWRGSSHCGVRPNLRKSLSHRHDLHAILGSLPVHGTGIGLDRSDTKHQRMAKYFVSRSGYVPLCLLAKGEPRRLPTFYEMNNRRGIKPIMDFAGLYGHQSREKGDLHQKQETVQ